MSPTPAARDRRLLIELSRINNEYGVQQRAAMRELARSRHELAEARGVLGAVVHDLRTPLQAVLGFTEFLLDEELDPEQRELAERIADAGRTMSELTDELLSTLAGTTSAPAPERVDLAHLVEELTDRFCTLAPRTGVNVVADRSGTQDLWVTGSAAKLRRAFENLISNAIKFSPVGGTVTVRLERRDDAIELSVRDEGPGIDPAEHEAVFAPFHRVAGEAPVPGVGLGLAIVRQIVEQHRGMVWVESQPGQGATFLIRLPLSPRD